MALEEYDGKPVDFAKPVQPTKQHTIYTGSAGMPVVPDKPYNNPSIGDTVGAYFRQHNFVGSWLADKTRGVGIQYDGSFDSDTELAKYPDLLPYKDKLETARNKEQFTAMAEQMRMENRDKDTIEKSEGFISNALGITASAVDPTLLIPGTVVVKGAKGVGTVAKTIAASTAASAATGFVSGKATETTQLLADPDMAKEYAAFGAIGGFLFGGAVGTKVASVMSREAKHKYISDLYDSYAPRTSGDAGAARVHVPGGEDGSLLAGDKARAVIEGRAKLPGFTSSNMKLATSESAVVRDAANAIGNNAFIRERNQAGIASAQSVELGAQHLTQTLEGEVLKAYNTSWKEFKNNYSKMDFSAMADELKLIGRNLTATDLSKMKPDRQTFDELWVIAGRNGRTSALPEIAQGVSVLGSTFDKLGKAANESGLFEKLHQQAGRKAEKHVLENSALAKAVKDAGNSHQESVVIKKAAQYLRWKDQLYALKTEGKANSPRAIRLQRSIDNIGKELENNSGVIANIEKQFSDELNARGAGAKFDINIRNEISRELIDRHRDSATNRKQVKKQRMADLKDAAQRAYDDAYAESTLLNPTTAKSYVPRMFDVDKIVADQGRFKDIVSNFYINHRGVDPEEAIYQAQQIYNGLQVRNESMAKMAKSAEEAKTLNFSSMNARTLDIPDNVISEFLVNDPIYLAKKYIADMTKAIEFNRVFNGRSFGEVLDDVIQDFNRMILEVKHSPTLTEEAKKKEMARLEQVKAADKAELTALYNRVIGSGGEAEDWFRVPSRLMKSWANVTSLGGIVFSSIPDLGRLISIEGFGRPVRAFAAMFDSSFRKLSKEEAEHFGYGFEVVLASRSNALADVGTGVSRLRPNTGEKVLDAINRNFHTFTGFNAWNSWMKRFAGVIHADKFTKAILDYDNMAPDMIAHLAASGIDRDMAVRIAEQTQKHGIEAKTFKFANTVLWDDQIARDTFERAVMKQVNHTIMTPDMGSVPTWMKSNLGSLIGQFQSFAYATEEQMIAAGIQRGSANEMKGVISMMALGYAAARARDGWYDKDPKDIDYYIGKGVMNSGVFGLPGMLNEKAGALGMGIDDLFDGEQEKRTNGMKVASTLLGPAPSKLLEAGASLINIAEGVSNKQDMWNAVKAIPGQNIPYVKKLSDMYKSDVEDFFGY